MKNFSLIAGCELPSLKAGISLQINFFGIPSEIEKEPESKPKLNNILSN